MIYLLHIFDKVYGGGRTNDIPNRVRKKEGAAMSFWIAAMTTKRRKQILYGIRMSLHHPSLTGSLGMNFLLCHPDILEHTASGMLLPSNSDVFHLHLPCHFMLLT